MFKGDSTRPDHTHIPSHVTSFTCDQYHAEGYSRVALPKHLISLIVTNFDSPTKTGEDNSAQCRDARIT